MSVCACVCVSVCWVLSRVVTLENRDLRTADRAWNETSRALRPLRQQAHTEKGHSFEKQEFVSVPKAQTSNGPLNICPGQAGGSLPLLPAREQHRCKRVSDYRTPPESRLEQCRSHSVNFMVCFSWTNTLLRCVALFRSQSSRRHCNQSIAPWRVANLRPLRSISYKAMKVR